MQPRQVDQVISAQGLVPKVTVYQTEATKPASACAHATHVRQHELRRVAENDVVHHAAPIDQNPDLPAGCVRDAHQCARELWSREPIKWNLVPIDPLKRLCFRRAESARVAVNLQRCLSSPDRHVGFDDAEAAADVVAADPSGESTVGLYEIGSHQSEVRVLFPGA